MRLGMPLMASSFFIVTLLLSSLSSLNNKCVVKDLSVIHKDENYTVYLVEFDEDIRGGYCDYSGYFDGKDIYLNKKLGKWGRYQTYAHEKCHMLLRRYITGIYKGNNEEEFCEEIAMLVVGGDEATDRILT